MAAEGPAAKVEIRYLASSLRGTGPRVSYTAATRSKVTEVHEVELHNGRALLKCPPEEQLSTGGFALVPSFRSAVHDDLEKIENPAVYHSGAFEESEASRAAREVYFSECEELVQRLTGATAAFQISHAVRNGPGNRHSAGVEYLTAYATFAHTDYTREILPGAWKMLKKRGVPENVARRMRCAFFNVWQPTKVPVEQHPLALLDWTSVDAEDVVSVTLGYSVTPSSGGSARMEPPIGQVLHNPRHRWYFFPDMQPHEALVFTQVDDREGRPLHSFHTAVKHASKANPVPRQSVEVRILCGFLDAADSSIPRGLTASEKQAKL